MFIIYLVSEPDSDHMLNLTSVEVLSAYLDSFVSPNITTTNTNDSSDGLSAGAIAGIVVFVIAILIILAVISAVSIYFYKHRYRKYKTR